MTKWSFKKIKRVKIIIVKPDQQNLWHKCERLEYDIFHDCGYIQPSAKNRIEYFDEYKRVEFIAAIFDSRQGFPEHEKLMGVMRIVYPSNDTNQKIADTFPTLRNARKIGYSSWAASENSSLKVPFENNNVLWLFSDRYDQVMKLNPSHCIDLATIAISSEGRRMKAIYAINARAVTRVWEQPPLRYSLLAVDHGVYCRYKAKGLPITELGPPVLYWGSLTVPILIDFNQIPTGIQKIMIFLYQLKGYIGIK